MLFDEPTMSLDPIVAVRVLDLVIQARDVKQISSIYVTKKIYEIPYLANFPAVARADGKVITLQAPPDDLPKTRVMVLNKGKIFFSGPLQSLKRADCRPSGNSLRLMVTTTRMILTSPTLGQAAASGRSNSADKSNQGRFWGSSLRRDALTN